MLLALWATSPAFAKEATLRTVTLVDALHGAGEHLMAHACAAPPDAATACSETQGRARSESERIALEVMMAYFDAQAQKALLKVGQQGLDQVERHLTLVQGLVELGLRSESDLAEVRKSLAGAAVRLLRAEDAYGAAKARLNRTMGIEQSTDYEVADDAFPPIPGEDGLLVGASPHRGRVAVFIALESREQRWGWHGETSRAASRSRFEGQTDLWAQASVDRLVRLQIEAATFQVLVSKASLAAADEALAMARELLGRTEALYEAGATDAAELGDAQLSLTHAADDRVQADLRLSVARTRLLKALGHLPTAAPNSIRASIAKARP